MELAELDLTHHPVLLKQVRIIDATESDLSDRFADVLISTDDVMHVGVQDADLPADARILDRSGLVLGTGLVDLYSTSGEPGFERRETIASLTKAAQCGGFSRVGILPHTKPAIDNLTALEFWSRHDRARSPHHPQLMPWGAITLDCAGNQLTDLAEMAEAVIGFTDAKPLPNLMLVRRAMEYIKPLGKPLMLWAYDPNLAGSGVMREGKRSLQYGLTGSSATAETAALAALIELVALIGTPTHFMRISTARSVELIAQAKSQGLPITASVAWMHLWLTDKDLHTYDPSLHLKPPLGSDTDRDALIAAVKSGIIDAIAVDHAPYTYEEKTVAFEVSPTGAIGLEFALPVLWQELVETGLLSGLELWRSLSSGAARCLGIDTKEESLPLATLFDPSLSWTVTSEAIASLAQNTPCLGKSIVGKVIPIANLSSSA
ncbi:dihydroorotase [Pseudanabaena sp. PCC 6802]|uniref:dihydroorotase n=1 Tax=Pseudanabaena sp. PCC 6802 TaxID=118173 RepID=UPI000380AD03|nr:dihydroorotase [Pseudanabaena sp. PCC 6802]